MVQITDTAIRLGKMAGRNALNFLLPPTCAACDKLIDQPPGLCPDCWQQLQPITKPYCARLGIPFKQDLGPNALSAQAIANPPIVNRVRAAVIYNDIARQLVTGLKYYDRPEQSAPIGQLMVQAGHELIDEADLIMPVPLHWRRQFSRRYNQSQLLARAISKKSGLPHDPLILKRARSTKQQVGLSHTQRAQNVKNAFKINPEKAGLVLGKNILLIDDVYTSGATGNAAAQCLLKAGAAQVDMLVFAQAIRDKKNPT